VNTFTSVSNRNCHSSSRAVPRSGRLWRSRNGGDDWQIVGSDDLAGLNITAVIPTRQQDVVLVSTLDKRDAGNNLIKQGGIFRSTDGGATFSRLVDGSATDLIADPGNPERFYAAIVGQGVFVGNDVSIGDNVRIQNNVSVYDAVTLEDDVFCGPSVVFTNVFNPRAAVPRKNEYRPTRVRRGATLGANCTVVCGTTIGEFAFVGAGAVVSRDVPAYALVVGVPARRIGWMSRHGERLALPARGHGEAACPATGEQYVLDGDILRVIS
jgi:UDP-2-acetamido-3-amino-2,3-dideoxy-glucuronate N-acetyltransferase